MKSISLGGIPIHVHIENKKVAGGSVTHRTKGNVAVKEVHTTLKIAQVNEIDAPVEMNGSLVRPVGYQVVHSRGCVRHPFLTARQYIYCFPARTGRGPVYPGVILRPRT